MARLLTLDSHHEFAFHSKRSSPLLNAEARNNLRTYSVRQVPSARKREDKP